MMDMGLDEIIKKKKMKKNVSAPRRRGGVARPSGAGGKGRRRGGRGGGGGVGGLGGGGGGVVVDARLKIIQKKRANMRDARERLMEIARSTDARNKISPRVNQASPLTRGRAPGLTTSSLSPLSGRNGAIRSPAGGGSFASNRMAALPRRTIRNQNISSLTYADRRDQILYRTVKNPTSQLMRGGRMMDDEAMEVDGGMMMDWGGSGGGGSGRLQVLVSNPPSGPLHHPVQSLRSNSSSEDSWLRPAPNKQTVYRGRDDVKSRLEPARGGLHQPEGYRIVVSNLQQTVTHEDIKELFEDIGVLIGSRVVRPGTAEVVYKNMDDALVAVDTYHNRQLDGQPMKCMLVKPSHVSGKEISGGKGTIVPDLHAIHKALFNK